MSRTKSIAPRMCEFCNSNSHLSYNCRNNMPVIIALVKGEMPNLKNIDKGTLKRMVMYIRQKHTSVSNKLGITLSRNGILTATEVLDFSYPRNFTDTRWIDKKSMACVYNDLPKDKSPALKNLLGNLTQATKKSLIDYLSMHYKDQRRGRFGLKVSSLQQDNIREEEVCAICMEQFGINTRTVATNCGHMFCTGCYTQAILSSRIPNCPMCRSNLMSEGTR